MSTQAPADAVTEAPAPPEEEEKRQSFGGIRRLLRRGDSASDYDFTKPPSVNLIPQRILDEEKVRRAMVIAGAMCAGSVLAVAFGYGLASLDKSRAQDELDEATAQNARLSAEVAQYADVPLVFSAAEQAEMALSSAMGAEIRWSQVLNDLSYITPDSVGLVTMNATLSAEAYDAASADGPIDPNRGVASLDYTGDALSYSGVSAWMAALDAEPTYLPPSQLTSASQDETLVSFNTIALLSRSALSERYLAPGEDVGVAQQAPAAEPAPEADEGAGGQVAEEGR